MPIHLAATTVTHCVPIARCQAWELFHKTSGYAAQVLSVYTTYLGMKLIMPTPAKELFYAHWTLVAIITAMFLSLDTLRLCCTRTWMNIFRRDDDDYASEAEARKKQQRNSKEATRTQESTGKRDGSSDNNAFRFQPVKGTAGVPSRSAVRGGNTLTDSPRENRHKMYGGRPK